MEEIYGYKFRQYTRNKYEIFKEKVQELLANYQENDQERFDLVRRIEQTSGNQASTIELISGNS